MLSKIQTNAVRLVKPAPLAIALRMVTLASFSTYFLNTLVLSALIYFNSVHAAEKEGIGCPKSGRSKKFYEDALEHCEKEKTFEDKLACIKKVTTSYCDPSYTESPQDQACKEATKDFSTSQREFINACGDAKMAIKGGKDSVGCSDEMKKCLFCQGADEEEAENFKCEPAPPKAKKSKSEKSEEREKTVFDLTFEQLQGLLSGNEAPSKEELKKAKEEEKKLNERREKELESVRKTMNSCPALAGEGLEAFEKEVQDLEKDLDELKEKLPEKELAVAEAKQERTDAKNKMEEELRERTKQFEARNKELRQNLSDSENNVLKDVEAQEALYNQIADNILQMKQKQVEAEMLLQEAVRRLENTCHATALARLNRDRDQIAKDIQAKTHKDKDSVSLFKRAGLTTRKQNQIKAQQYYNDCIKDKTFTDAQKSAVSGRDHTLDVANNTINSLMKQQNRIVEKIQELKTRVRSENARKITEDLSENFTEFQTDRKAIEGRFFIEDQDSFGRKVLTTPFDAKILNAEKAVDEIKRKIKREEDFFRQKKRLLQLRQELARDNGSSEPGKYRTASAKYNETITRAEEVIASCGCNSAQSAKGACVNACKFSRVTSPDGIGLCDTSAEIDEASKKDPAPATGKSSKNTQ